MKKVLGTIFLMGSHCVFAYTGAGVCQLGKETTDKVICYGPTVLKDTTVTGEVKIAGPLKASGVTMDNMTVVGSAELDNCVVKGIVSMAGSFQATNVRFEKGVEVKAAYLRLNHSRIKGNLVMQSDNKKPMLSLECGTMIDGDLIFIGKAGTVQITDDSLIKGTLKNGDMEFIKSHCER